jgi:hypothetical protein
MLSNLIYNFNLKCHAIIRVKIIIQTLFSVSQSFSLTFFRLLGMKTAKMLGKKDRLNKCKIKTFLKIHACKEIKRMKHRNSKAKISKSIQVSLMMINN